jgi:hypothetical protein
MEELPVTHPDFGKWRRGLRVNDPQAKLAKMGGSPDIIAEPISEPVVEVTPDPVPDPRDAEIEALKARVADLETQPLSYPDEAPEPEPAAPYVPDFTMIPDQLAKYAEADEGSAEFRNRLKSYWQRFGIADGENFPGGGEPLTADEKIQMREIDILLNSDEGKAARLHDWLFAD